MIPSAAGGLREYIFLHLASDPFLKMDLKGKRGSLWVTFVSVGGGGRWEREREGGGFHFSHLKRQRADFPSTVLCPSA